MKCSSRLPCIRNGRIRRRACIRTRYSRLADNTANTAHQRACDTDSAGWHTRHHHRSDNKSCSHRRISPLRSCSAARHTSYPIVSYLMAQVGSSLNQRRQKSRVPTGENLTSKSSLSASVTDWRATTSESSVRASGHSSQQAHNFQ